MKHSQYYFSLQSYKTNLLKLHLKMTETRQYIWLVRYGRTFPGLIEGVGNYDSDVQDPEGLEDAKAIANHIASKGTDRLPKHVFSDPFLRCMRTADVIVSTLNERSNASLKIKVESGMTEWQVPSLLVDVEGKRTHPRSVQHHAEELENVDESYQSVNPHGPDRDTESLAEGVPSFPETEEQLYVRCRTTARKILEHTGSEDSILIVSHAPCCQSMALALAGFTSPSESKLGGWSLGGVTLFSRIVGSEEWTLEYYSDTSHMPGEYKEGIKGRWSLPGFVKNNRNP